MLLDFGGHPSMHRYNFAMFRRRQEEALRQGEYKRLLRAAKPGRRNRGFLRKWAGQLGTRLIHWGRKLERVGVREQPVMWPSPHH